MAHRKGFPRIPLKLDEWDKNSPTARDIRQGTHWFDAWQAHRGMIDTRISHLSGIPRERFYAMRQGDKISRAEVDALACVFSVSANDLIKSMDSRNRIVD